MSADDRFDELGKALAASTSRRRFFKVAAAAAAGAVLSLVRVPEAAASHNRRCRGSGDNCTSNAQCCTHFCGPDFHCACAVPCAGVEPPDGVTTDCCEPGDVCCNGQCIPSSQTLCSGGQIFNTTTCRCECPAGTTLCNNQCVQVCTPPKVLNANCQCVCPPNTTTCGGTCCPSGTQCVNGICQNVTTCGAGNCPAGCCQNNVCQPGNTNAACGTGGNPCATCTPPNVCCGPPSLGQCKRPSGAACTGNGQCCSNICNDPPGPIQGTCL